MQKIIRRSWAKCRNCQKQCLACKRRAKNIENSISLISETQKTQKNTRIRGWNQGNGKKSLVIRGWNQGNGKKSLVIRGWNQENGENIISAAAENQKQANSAFRPRPTNEKCRKLTFGHGRRVKNSKNSISATAENLSFINFNAWQCILPQQKLNEMTVPGKNLTLGTPNFVFYRRLK